MLKRMRSFTIRKEISLQP